MLWKSIERKLGKTLAADPLLRRLETCHSSDDILTILQMRVPSDDQSRNGEDRLTKWLKLTVNVLNTLSVTVGEGDDQAYPPPAVIFTDIGVLFSAIASSSQEAPVDLFERIESSFRRFETYIKVPPTSGMADILTKVMVEVLFILAIVTREIGQNSAMGGTEFEDALQRLDKLTQEEDFMAAAEGLKATRDVDNK
ncbi:hypothetical protein BJV74DRAFT_796533 [Russula compacta]|nr:hypothetical protein BJV74DRAFT_796533 [Russula compacta]